MSRTIEERKAHLKHMIGVNQDVIKRLDVEIVDAEGARHANLQREIIRASDFIADLEGMLLDVEQDEHDIQMFGMTVQDMRAEFERDSFSGDVQMWIMGILSDAQHAIEYGNNEQARQWINKAKYWVRETRINQEA